jgi:hypothetical protein
MTHLEQISIQQYCEICHLYFLSIDPSTTDTEDEEDPQSSRTHYLQSVLRMCEKNLLERLHVNVMFLLEYGHPLHVNEEKISMRVRPSGVKGSPAAGGQGVLDYESPTGLRKAISESVQDVTSLLTYDEGRDHLDLNMDLESEPYYTNPLEEKRVGKKIENPVRKRSSFSSATETQRGDANSKANSSSSGNRKPMSSSASVSSKKRVTGGASHGKPVSAGGGGIYKLLLQESASSSAPAHYPSHGHVHHSRKDSSSAHSGHTPMGTEIDTSILHETSSSHSHSHDEEYEEYGEEDYYYDYSLNPVTTGPILIDSGPPNKLKQPASRAAMDRKGKTLNVEEFIRSQHSLAPPPTQKKLTPSQKRFASFTSPLLS